MGVLTRILLMILVFLSGAAGLVYEVVWARQLGLFLGTTAWAHAAVLTAFMAGLGFGSLYFGKRADRDPSPLKRYAQLEIGIAIFGATTPWLFTWLQQAYAALAPTLGHADGSGNWLRFMVAIVALLFPTFMMGGTLPLLVKGLRQSGQDSGVSTGRLYGLNTFGAAFGAFAAGYLLLPNLGIPMTLGTAVAANVLVGMLVWAITDRHGPASQPDATDNRSSIPDRRLSSARWFPVVVLGGFALSGFAALLYQVVWIRSLTLVIGGSVYAFSATITTFLFGIALGSILIVPLLRRTAHDRRLALAGWIQFGVAMSALATLFLIPRLPELFAQGYGQGWYQYFGLFQFFQFGLCFAVMLVPTLLLGALFPLIASIWIEHTEKTGEGVGVAYAANTLGTIGGALLGSLVIRPWLGIQNSLIAASVLSLLVAVVFLVYRDPPVRRRWAPAAICLLLFVGMVAAVPPWDIRIMNSGVFRGSDNFLDPGNTRVWFRVIRDRDVLFYDEGLEGTVMVYQRPDQRTLLINGKADASSVSDAPTQVMLGQLPMLLHSDPRDVLVIGMGSGITAGAITTHEAVESLDVVEISPGVIEAARYFEPENRFFLDDPRTEVIRSDARNFLLATDREYDVIISEPSNPWISGVSNLFTQEAFEASASKLREGGIMVQWFHTYDMDVAEIEAEFATFRSVFPYASLWMPMPSDLIMLGSKTPQALDLASLRELRASGGVAEQLTSIEIESIPQVVDMLLVGDELGVSVGEDSKLNSDNFPRLEFNAARLYHTSNSDLIMNLFGELIDGEEQGVRVVNSVSGSEGLLRHNLLNVDIDFAALERTPRLEEDWVAQRNVLSTPESRKRLVYGNRLGLRWSLGERNFRFMGQPEVSSADEQTLFRLLDGALPDGISREGRVDLPDGLVGAWGQGPVDDENHKVVIAWHCIEEGGTTNRFLATVVGPGREDETWRDSLAELGGIFRCN